MPKVKVASEDVFYAQRCPEGVEGALVFIHGAGGTHRHWGYQLQALSGANLYAPDLPGHGRSGGEAQRSIGDYVEFLSGFLGALGLERTSLAGHSMGGAIAQAFALDHHLEVERLILVGTGARLRVLPSILAGLLTEFESTLEMILGYAFSANASQELVELGRQVGLANPPEVMRGDFLACDKFDVMDRLGEIRSPTLIICGEEDQMTPPKYSQFLREQILDARLTIIPGAGHMVMLEQPERVNRAIEEFLRATTA